MCGHEQPSVCWKISQPSIIDYGIGTSIFYLTFNETVQLDGGWTSADYHVAMEGPMTPYSLDWDFLSAPDLLVPYPNYTVYFSYETSNQVFGNGSESLTIYFNDTTRLQNSAYGFGMINSSLTFTGLVPADTTEACGDMLFNFIIYICFGITLIVGVLSAVLGHSYAIVWMSLSILQFTHFSPVMMIFAPTCVSFFGSRLSSFNAQFGNFFKYFTDKYLFQRDTFFTVIDFKFIRAGYDTGALLYNSVDLSLFWLVIGIILLINYLIRLCFRDTQSIVEWEQQTRKHILFVMSMF